MFTLMFTVYDTLGRNSHVTEPDGSPKCPQRIFFSLCRNKRQEVQYRQEKASCRWFTWVEMAMNIIKWQSGCVSESLSVREGKKQRLPPHGCVCFNWKVFQFTEVILIKSPHTHSHVSQRWGSRTPLGSKQILGIGYYRGVWGARQ